MKYMVPNKTNNEWLEKYNKLISDNANNTQVDATYKRMRIIPTIIDPNIATTDDNNYVWVSETDFLKAKEYLWRYHPYFALSLWFSTMGNKKVKGLLTSKEILQVKKDAVAVKAGKIVYSDVQDEHYIYLANGLFCTGDRLFNDVIYDRLTKEPGWKVYAPQKNLAINDKKKSAPSLPIYDGDTAELQKADIIIAVLDGQDLGVATEIGWVAGWNEGKKKNIKRIVGIYTDNRDASKTASKQKNDDMVSCGVAECQYPYINLYTIGAIKKYGTVVGSLEEAIAYIKHIQ